MDSRRRLDQHGIELVENTATALVGPRGALEGVRLGSGRLVPASLLFFSLAHRPRTRLAEALGCRLDKDGYVASNDCGQTSVPHVYACGDLVPGLQLTAVAAAKGVVEGVGAARSMFGQRGASTSPAAAPDPAGWRQELVG